LNTYYKFIDQSWESVLVRLLCGHRKL